MWGFVCSFLLLLINFNTFNNEVTAKTMTTVVQPKKVECFVRDSSLIKQFNCSLDTKTSGLNEDLIYARNVPAVKCELKVFIDIYGRKSNFYSTEFDYCDSLSSRNEHFLMDYMMKEVGRKANLVEGCPFKKNKLYYLRDFNVSMVKAQPYWPVLNWSLEIVYFVENKAAYAVNLSGVTVKI